MTTHREQILDFILRFPGRDDDEISSALQIKPRQTVNMICRELAETGAIERLTGPRGKLANYPRAVESGRKPQIKTEAASRSEQDVEVEVAPKSKRPELTVERLNQAGFKHVGIWRLAATGELSIDPEWPIERGTYAFIMGGKAQYVGVASTGLKQRLASYAKPGPTQRTSQRLNQILRAELSSGGTVGIYLATPNDFEWGGLPMNGRSGLEIGLIENYCLPWNIRGLGADQAPRTRLQKIIQAFR